MSKPGAITIPYDENRLEMIREFTDPGTKSLEEELLETLDGIYQKRVPKLAQRAVARLSKEPGPESKTRKSKGKEPNSCTEETP